MPLDRGADAARGVIATSPLLFRGHDDVPPPTPAERLDDTVGKEGLREHQLLARELAHVSSTLGEASEKAIDVRPSVCADEGESAESPSTRRGG